MMIGIKEVIKLDKQVLEDRFLLDEGAGVAGEFILGNLNGSEMKAGGFFYTNKDSLQITFALSSITVFSVISLALLHFFLNSCRFQIVLKKCSGTSISVRKWFKIFILGKLLNTFL